MSYIIRAGDSLYIKRTAQFGLYHGAIQYTDRIDQALQFTRKDDADQRAAIAKQRVLRSKEINGKELHRLQKLGLDETVEFIIENQ